MTEHHPTGTDGTLQERRCAPRFGRVTKSPEDGYGDNGHWHGWELETSYWLGTPGFCSIMATRSLDGIVALNSATSFWTPLRT